MRNILSKPDRLGVMFAFLAAFGFSFKAIFVKLSYATAPVDAVTLLTLRMVFCLPFVMVACVPVLRGMPRLSRRDVGMLLLLGGIGYYGSSMLDFYGLQYISAGLERLILFTYPTLTILIGVLFLGKPAERSIMLAAMLSYAGIAIAFVHDASQSNDVHSVALGAGFVFGCAVLYALYSAGSEVAIKRLGAMRFSLLSILVATAAVALHFLLSRPWQQLLLPAPVYGYSLGMALFSTILPIVWQSLAIRHIGAARAVLIGMLGPVLTIFFGWWLLHEAVSLSQLAGTVLVISGVLLASRR
ncbi:threonine/homoserine efflux transporter RhtA [Vogesella indigofera]|uniref:Threonine/homoserine efflux transporter RhtA n=1 Tax=Vogesella indigofera TaxID=45465 RepID=A0A495BC25_VOGIN|nr:DMT family transporter [Vogesella indigofera]RKQ58033.1 threonine/homoserine efflux transporter RhtA [Vogesella indigofera]